MPEGATTLTAHLHHHQSLATASPSSYAYHERRIITWLLKQAKLHTADKRLTAQGSATGELLDPKTPILNELRSYTHSHRFLSRKKAGQESR